MNEQVLVSTSEYVPASQQSAAQLRANACEYRRMAATASMADIRNSLLKLADRFDALADQRERWEGG